MIYRYFLIQLNVASLKNIREISMSLFISYYYYLTDKGIEPRYLRCDSIRLIMITSFSKTRETSRHEVIAGFRAAYL
jgi:hypothetical protein